jgi:hypothetical protein
VENTYAGPEHWSWIEIVEEFVCDFGWDKPEQRWFSHLTPIWGPSRACRPPARRNQITRKHKRKSNNILALSHFSHFFSIFCYHFTLIFLTNSFERGLFIPSDKPNLILPLARLHETGIFFGVSSSERVDLVSQWF